MTFMTNMPTKNLSDKSKYIFLLWVFLKICLDEVRFCKNKSYYWILFRWYFFESSKSMKNAIK